MYHNLFITGVVHLLGVPVSQYIGDHHVGKLFSSPARTSLAPSKVLAEAAAYIMCYLLIDAGYFIGIAKSQWVASTIVCFLGFLCNSSRQAFLMPDDKTVKFSSLREQKVISFSLAVPVCKLYIREMFKTISRLGRSLRPFVCVDGDLRAEILYWPFFGQVEGLFPLAVQASSHRFSLL